MKEKALFCKNTLIQYINDYLENEISKEEYYDLSERCYSIYGNLLQMYYSEFNDIFLEVVPDVCLYYIDEPGLGDFMKDELFRKNINEVYDKLINL